MSDVTAARPAHEANPAPDANQLLDLLRKLADSVAAIIAYVDRNERVVYANRALERWADTERGSLVGLTFSEVFGVHARETLAGEIARAFGGELATFEAWVPRGVERRFIAGMHIPDSTRSGSARGFFAVYMDDTERRIAEDRSRQELERTVRLAQTAPVISFTAGADARLTYVGRAWQEYFGAGLEASRDWVASGLVHPDDARAFCDAWAAAAERREAFDAEFRGRRRDGAYRWLMCRAVPVQWEADPDLWVGVILDIHERKQLEEERERFVDELAASLIEVRQSRALLDIILQTAPVGIDFFDREHRFVRVNEAAAEINGLPVEAHIGRRVDEVLPHVESQIALMQHVLDTGEIVRDVEVSGETPAMPGVRRWWLASYYPVAEKDGSVQGTGVIFREITETKRHEEERERLLAEAQAANAAKDEFLGLISHELKTPITTIRGNAEILSRHRKRLDEAQLEAALTDIDEASERLNDIIDNLLLLARIERNLPPEREPVLLWRLVQRVAQEHSKKYAHRRVITRIDAYTGLVEGSSLYIEQIMTNLLSNAEKYSPRNEPIEVEISRDAGEVCVNVLDHGPGIDETEAEQIFEPFYRGKELLTRAPGVGVGLAVCKRLIEAQDGRMWVGSRPGGGAVFSFCLPVAEDLTVDE